MKNILAAVLIVSALAGSSCATFSSKVDNTITDIDSCIPPDASKTLFSAAGQFLEQTLLCDVESGGMSPANLVADLPACAQAAIPAIESSLGPEGSAFVTCSLQKIKDDPNALAQRKTRAGVALARRAHR